VLAVTAVSGTTVDKTIAAMAGSSPLLARPVLRLIADEIRFQDDSHPGGAVRINTPVTVRTAPPSDSLDGIAPGDLSQP
jgi:hypothetical protein